MVGNMSPLHTRHTWQWHLTPPSSGNVSKRAASRPFWARRSCRTLGDFAPCPRWLLQPQPPWWRQTLLYVPCPPWCQRPLLTTATYFCLLRVRHRPSALSPHRFRLVRSGYRGVRSSSRRSWKTGLARRSPRPASNGRRRSGPLAPAITRGLSTVPVNPKFHTQCHV